MKLPDWLASQTDEAGQLVQAGQIPRQAAVTTIRDAILAQSATDDAFLKSVIADFASRALADWDRRNGGGSAHGLRDTQSDLFPGLPVRLYVRPGVRKPLILMTAHDWDMARNVLRNRTSNAKQAAESDWARFQAAYDQVRPLLSGELTTAEIAPQLEAAARAAGAP
jgi:hypothetical protein